MDPAVAELIASAKHPTLRAMVALWESKRAGRKWPSRTDFDPSEMVFALGDISLFDVEENPRRFWCRLDGTRQVELFGVDCTRRYLHECFEGDYYQLAKTTFDHTVESGRVQYHERETPYNGRIIKYELAMLPLSSNGAKVDQLMVVITPHWD